MRTYMRGAFAWAETHTHINAHTYIYNLTNNLISNRNNALRTKPEVEIDPRT